MNRTYNSLKPSAIRVVIFSLVTIFMLPSAAYALPSQASDAASGSSNAKTSEFCTNLSNEENSVNQRMNNLISNAESHWSTSSQDWQNIWSRVDQKVSDSRQKADTERLQDFTKLQAKAKNTAEQQAVQTYITAVTNAVSTRRSAYDAARQAFRAGVEAAISSRGNTVTDQFNIFKESVTSSFAIAQTSCTADPSGGQTYRKQLQTSLRTARLTFESGRKNDQTVPSQIKQLVATRNAAFKAADQTFKSSMQSARQALLAAFQASGNSASID